MTSLCAQIFLIFLLALAGCAYRWGSSDRTLPGGYRQVHIPIFKNYTPEPGIEVDFTNAIRQEFERSRVARISDSSRSEVELVGEISALNYVPQAPVQGNTVTQPTGTVMATAYDIRLAVKITLKRKSDGAVLWSSDFVSSRSYIAPQVTVPVVNTVNPLYNLSARRQNIQILSQSMMAEAHDRMTENF